MFRVGCLELSPLVETLPGEARNLTAWTWPFFGPSLPGRDIVPVRVL
jgi:hypothetical protein